jgi:signal-transduction protein with cAMP-binding, CBS, and nucleotidyltransferase domain
LLNWLGRVTLTRAGNPHTLALPFRKDFSAMSLLQWCDEGPATVELSATVEDAVRTMIDKTVGAVAVIDDQGVVAGMFTERDVLAKFALSARDPKSTPVRELMSPMVEMATEQTTPVEALGVMLERHYRHMPIVDDQGKVLGICSIRNILEARINDLLTQSATPAK